jgi:arylsulfatase A
MKPSHSLLSSLHFGLFSLACLLPGLDEEGGATTRPAAEAAPNIVYILADDLGYGEVGAYGQTRIRTPHLDRLAGEGMIFSQHYSGSPVCAPSRCVLLTGLHTGHAVVRNNWENGGWEQGAPEGQFPLPEEAITIAELLREGDYKTGAFGKWGNGGPQTSGHPLAQGFDSFLGYLCQRQAHNYYPTHLWKDNERLDLEGNDWFASHQKLTEPLESDDDYYERYSRQSFATDAMIEGALEFIDENKEQPFFLYYASPVPHAALQVPREEVEKYAGAFEETAYLGEKGYLPHPRPRAAYAAMVSRMDSNIGRILERLERYDLAERTVVMFSSDNGPTFNGGTDSTFFNSAAGMRGLKCSVYEGGLRVPFIVRWPGQVEAGVQSAHLSAFQDILPTVVELAGMEVEVPTDGKSLLPTLLGLEGQQEHEFLYWEYAGQQAIRRGPWKGVRSALRKGDLSLQLYNLEDDPTESRDVAADHPELCTELEQLLAREHVPSTDFPLPGVDTKQ